MLSEGMGCGCVGIACDMVWPRSFIRPLSFLIYNRRAFPLSRVRVGAALKKVWTSKRQSHLDFEGTWLCSVAGSDFSVVGNRFFFFKRSLLEAVGVQPWWVQMDCRKSRCTWRRPSMTRCWLLPISSFSTAGRMDLWPHRGRKWRKWRC